ncbi:hypothetical protein [Bradyrhizobium sp. McL0615]|uniref:hypothetical protein n=1 Tax=Bradyrhizobium sp. McL0615 TaxID=3415673 RepID=UPI003CF3CE51
MNSQLEAAELVVTVHGTGSTGKTETARKWWENGSRFCTGMARLLGSGYVFDEPFQWSGLNWESARQKAGGDLFARLHELEKRGRPYHIISHSHGGSVTWAALIRSAEQKEQLRLLRSWTTIGTPFLTFAPTPINWPLIAATFVIALGIAAAVFLFAPAVDELAYIYDNATIAQLVATLGPLLICVAMLVATMIVIIGNLRSQIRYRRLIRVRHTAAEWYGALWLGIWHSQDEPISGLAATLDKAISITARRADTYPQHLRWLGRILDAVLSDVPDELAWRQFIRKLQGNDLTVLALASVERCPPELRPGWPEIPKAIGDLLIGTANSKAAKMLEGMRTLLGTAYETRNARGMVLGAGKLVTWGELVHTSYFEPDGLKGIVANHLLAGLRSKIPDSASDESPFARMAAPASGAARTALEQQPWYPKRLRELTAAVVLLTGAVFLLLAAAASRSSIFPYTTDFQVRAIANTVLDQGAINIGANSYLGKVILRLMNLGYLDDPLLVLNKLSRDNGRFEAAQPVAYAYGYNGQFDQVELLVGSVADEPNSFRAVTLKAVAINGAARAGRALPQRLVDAVTAFTNIDAKKQNEIELRFMIVNALYRSGQAKAGNKLLTQLWDVAPDQYSCDSETGLRRELEPTREAAAFILDRCENAGKLNANPNARIELLVMAERREDALRLAAQVPQPRSLNQLVEQLNVEFLRKSPSELNKQVIGLLSSASTDRSDVLYQHCGLKSRNASRLGAPVNLPMTHADFFDLHEISRRYEALSDNGRASQFDEVRSRFLKVCSENIALDYDNLDWAENLLKHSRSDAEARMLYEPALALARSLEEARQPRLAVDTYAMIIEAHTMNRDTRRAVMFKLEQVALQSEPPDINSLMNVARKAMMFDQELGPRFQKSVVGILSTLTDVTTRSDNRGTLAIYTGQSGMARDARLAAEGATEPIDRLRGYLGALDAAIMRTKGAGKAQAGAGDFNRIICEAECKG